MGDEAKSTAPPMSDAADASKPRNIVQVASFKSKRYVNPKICIRYTFALGARAWLWLLEANVSTRKTRP
jgi:hypothetical protein